MRQFAGDRLLFASHNRGKIEEVQELMAPHGVTVTTAAALGLVGPAETETSFLGNARIKAHVAAKAAGLPALADDSGIEIEALGGAPGIYTADWAETPQGRDYVQAMTRTWNALEALNAPEPRRACFRATLVLAWPDGHDEAFEGEVRGRLVWPMRGALGHGYDPIFMPEGYDITFGEMAAAEKNKISHRARAFEKLVSACFG